MIYRVGSAMFHVGWDWTIWLVGFTWEPAVYREDGVKHTNTELYFSLGPLHLEILW